jgi:hypothetical protein
LGMDLTVGGGEGELHDASVALGEGFIAIFDAVSDSAGQDSGPPITGPASIVAAGAGVQFEDDRCFHAFLGLAFPLELRFAFWSRSEETGEAEMGDRGECRIAVADGSALDAAIRERI